MNKILILLFISILQLGFSQGINFVSNDMKWSDVLAKAKADNKIIFVDVYTTWCGPCKEMDKNIFPLKEVGAFYNAQFINVKIDAEKGEGIEIAKKYNVTSYPTWLFIDGSGDLVHKSLGMRDAKDFIEIGKTATDTKHQFYALKKQYTQGGNTQEWLKTFSITCRELREFELAQDVVFRYLQGEKDVFSQENTTYACNFVRTTDSDLFKFIIEKQADFEKQKGAKFMSNLIEKTILSDVGKNAYSIEKRKYDLEKANKYLQTLNLSDAIAPKIMALVALQSYMTNRDAVNFKKATVDYYEHYPHDDAEALHRAASIFSEITDDTLLLQKALKWSIESTDLSPKYRSFRTTILLYWALGNEEKAKEYADKAMPFAKAEGLVISSSEIVLRDAKESYYYSKRDTANYLKVKVDYYDKYSSQDADELNTTAIEFYEKTDNKQFLEKALSWTLKSIDLNANYSNLNTAASLYYKLGDKQNAKVYADKAMVKGKQMNKMTEPTEMLLKKIEVMN